MTGAGAGGGPHVELWDGPNEAEPFSEFMAYSPTFTGGVSVAAGDVNGDGYDEIVTAAGPGGGPHVRIFNGAPDIDGYPLLNELGGFYAYEPGFHGGVQVAVGDFNGDAQNDIVTSPGAGGGPHIKIFDGDHVLGSTPSLATLGQFMAYAPTFTGGVTVGAADMGGGDDAAEVITGAGPGGGPHVKIIEPTGATMAGTGDGFMAFDPLFRGGVNVAGACTNGVARVAVGTATVESDVETFFPNGAPLGEGYTYDLPPQDFVARLPGFSVAIGSLSRQTPPGAQLVTGYADAVERGAFQITISSLENDQEILGGFDAYPVVIRMSVAIGSL